MSEEGRPNIVDRLESLEEKKADSTSIDKLRSEFEKKWEGKEKEDSEWKFEWNKVLEVAVIAQALTFIKLEIPPLLNTEALGDGLLQRIGLTRNKWGLIWKGRNDTDVLMDSVQRLQQMTTSAHQKIHHSNQRINVLERKVGNAGTASRRVEREIQRAARPGASGSELDQLARLERHVSAVARALG
ncbi:hypothetical protein ACWECC_02235 [Streptomyces microflavus]|uniref:hypothetical protein n=1 Tax=Streptomyces TaxID=1883 RepID=UPI0033B12F20